jgi:hypothetical protein
LFGYFNEIAFRKNSVNLIALWFESLLISLPALGPQLIDDVIDFKYVPSEDGVVQHRWAAERLYLAAKRAPP